MKTLEDYKKELAFLQEKISEGETFLKENPDAKSKTIVESIIKKSKLLVYRYKSVIKDLEGINDESRD